MMTFARKHREKLGLGVCLALAAVCVFTVLYYIALPSRTTFYADTSDTLYWAMAAYESGSVISPDFYYATLQPFGGLLFMLPFIPFFGFSLATHICGMLAFAVVFMAGMWFFCASLEITLNQKLVLFSAVLMLLSSSAKLAELMWEHVIYYSLGILFAALFMGLSFRLVKAMAQPKEKRKTGVIAAFCVLLFLLAAGVGTDGMQVLVLCTIPFAGALLAERFTDTKKKLLGRKNLQTGLVVLILLAGTAAGLVVLRFLPSGARTEYTELHMMYTATSNWAGNMLLLPEYWARLLGFSGKEGENIVNLAALFELLRLGVAILLAVVPVVAATKYAKLQSRQLRVALWFHGILSAILLLSHIVGSTANAHWRLTPMVFSSALVTVLYLMHCWETLQWRRIVALLAAVLFAMCALNVRSLLATAQTGGQNRDFYALADELESRGLHHGYADYQVAQPVTVLSGNSVKTRYVWFDEAGIRMFAYQTQKNWYEDVPGEDRYFLVMTPEEHESWKTEAGWQPLNEALVESFDVGPYRVLVFGQNPIGLRSEAPEQAAGA